MGASQFIGVIRIFGKKAFEFEQNLQSLALYIFYSLGLTVTAVAEPTGNISELDNLFGVGKIAMDFYQ